MTVEGLIVMIPILLIMAACGYEIYYWEKIVRGDNSNQVQDEEKNHNSTKKRLWPPWRRGSESSTATSSNSKWYGSFQSTKEEDDVFVMNTSSDDESDEVTDTDEDEDDVIKEAEDADLEDGDWVQDSHDVIRQRFRRLTRSLSVVATNIKRPPVPPPVQAEVNKVQDDVPGKKGLCKKTSFDVEKGFEDCHPGSAPLFECIFVSGLYHDCTVNKLIPFVKEIFPKSHNLPAGIAELCFPDSMHWCPQPQERTRTYTLVLTDGEGARMFGYCRRIQAEGDDVCLPLAMCILTRHSRSRGLFAQILDELATQYGRADYEMTEIFQHLQRQRFPDLGQTLEILCRPRESPRYSAGSSASEPVSQPDSRRQSLFIRTLQMGLDSRRNSAFGRLVLSSTSGSSKGTKVQGHDGRRKSVKRRIRRPIDFRLGGAPICSIFHDLEDILTLYSCVLTEKKVVVISSSLSDLSCLFDALEALLFPMSWQHTLIPALPLTHRGFLDAPTPYLIGLLVDKNHLPSTPIKTLERTSLMSQLSLPLMRLSSSESKLESESSKGSPPRRESVISSLCDNPDAEEEEQFLASLLNGTHEILDQDCMVVQISSDQLPEGRILKRPEIRPDFFPESMVDLLKERLCYFDRIFRNVEGGLDVEEEVRGKFVIICETSLQMYKTIFGHLVSYLQSEEIWTIPSDGTAKEAKFDLEEYMNLHVPETHREFFQEISETAMFDEYIRSRVLGSFRNIEITSSQKCGKVLHLKRKKSSRTSSVRQRASSSASSIKVMKSSLLRDGHKPIRSSLSNIHEILKRSKISNEDSLRRSSAPKDL